MTTTNKPRDPMVSFRSVIRGKNSKGGDRLQLYIGGDSKSGNQAIVDLIETLTTALNNPKGAKLDLHINKKEHEGRSFDSAFAFVKLTSEGGFGGASRTTYAPKGTATDQVKAAVQDIKSKVVR